MQMVVDQCKEYFFIIFWSPNILLNFVYYSARSATEHAKALCHQFIYYSHGNPNVQINEFFYFIIVRPFTCAVAFADSHFICLLRHKIKWESHPDELNPVSIKYSQKISLPIVVEEEFTLMSGVWIFHEVFGQNIYFLQASVVFIRKLNPQHRVKYF